MITNKVIEYRKAQTNRPRCALKGCDNLALPRSKKRGGYNKLCSTHMKVKYGMPQYRVEGTSGAAMKRRFPNKECSACGWQGPCDRHRVIPETLGGGYTIGNVTILCPNCHRLVHMGLLVVE